MVLGLALCSTVAFAQINNFRTGGNETKGEAVAKVFDGPQVDYKASIFTKDAGDTIHTFTFATTDMTGIEYEANGYITNANKFVYMYDEEHDTWVVDTLVPHGQTAAYAHWIRVNDSASIYSLSTHSTVLQSWMLTGIAQRMGRPVVSDDNGFMLMTMRAPMNSGVHDAFIKLRPIDRPSDAGIIDIYLTQAYAKFYDQCFIDFKVGSDWYTREINIDGVDVDINYWASYYGRWTMPVSLAQQSQIELRIRWYNRTVRSNAYGYFWAIDDVAIAKGAANRWYTNEENYTNGGYGQLPKGFSVPLSWYGAVYNNGSTTQTNSTLTMHHLDANRTPDATPLLSTTVASVPANPLAGKYMIIDESGFMPELDSVGYAGWFGMGTQWTNYGATTLGGGFQGRGLPTTEEGLQFVTTTLTNNASGIAPAEFDTVAYSVVDSIGGDANLSVPGYRWSHDNGIIPSGVKYAYGWIIQNGNPYITDSGNYGSTNYMVWVRYNTPANIPAGWVFRGMEIVPQTDVPANQIAGSNIFPIFYEEEYYGGGDSVRFNAINTGLSDVTPHSVTASELNTLTTGRLTNDDPYKAVNLQFTTQPTIKPNTSYYVGYRIAEPCFFAAARTSYNYKTASSTTSYYRDAAISDYSVQFEPNGYDVRIYDGANSERPYLWSSFYYNYYPMIRLIVGPERTIPNQHISAECDDNYTIITIDGETETNICGVGLDAPQGSDPSIYVIPAGDSAILGSHPGIIDNVKIDGQIVDLDNPPAGVQIVERPYNLTNANGDVLLRRSYYIITFSGINTNPTVSATAHAYSHGLGIEAEAANITLGLKPNPASSQVSLNIQGITGSVNCSIIDMSGRVVVSNTFNAEESHVIDLSNVAAGAYFVRVTNDNFSKIEKLIVR